MLGLVQLAAKRTQLTRGREGRANFAEVAPTFGTGMEGTFSQVTWTRASNGLAGVCVDFGFFLVLRDMGIAVHLLRDDPVVWFCAR